LLKCFLGTAKWKLLQSGIASSRGHYQARRLE
jgi:hypothetical protein